MNHFIFKFLLTYPFIYCDLHVVEKDLFMLYLRPFRKITEGFSNLNRDIWERSY